MTDVQHLGALGLDVTPLALSDRAIEHLLVLLVKDFHSVSETQIDQALSEKIAAELRIARHATISKRESSKADTGLTDEVREAAGMRRLSPSEVREANAAVHGDEPTEAERIAAKMAKASRDAVEGES